MWKARQEKARRQVGISAVESEEENEGKQHGGVDVLTERRPKLDGGRDGPQHWEGQNWRQSSNTEIGRVQRWEGSGEHIELVQRGKSKHARERDKTCMGCEEVESTATNSHFAQLDLDDEGWREACRKAEAELVEAREARRRAEAELTEAQRTEPDLRGGAEPLDFMPVYPVGTTAKACPQAPAWTETGQSFPLNLSDGNRSRRDVQDGGIDAASSGGAVASEAPTNNGLHVPSTTEAGMQPEGPRSARAPDAASAVQPRRGTEHSQSASPSQHCSRSCRCSRRRRRHSLGCTSKEELRKSQRTFSRRTQSRCSGSEDAPELLRRPSPTLSPQSPSASAAPLLHGRVGASQSSSPRRPRRITRTFSRTLSPARSWSRPSSLRRPRGCNQGRPRSPSQGSRCLLRRRTRRSPSPKPRALPRQHRACSSSSEVQMGWRQRQTAALPTSTTRQQGLHSRRRGCSSSGSPPPRKRRATALLSSSSPMRHTVTGQVVARRRSLSASPLQRPRRRSLMKSRSRSIPFRRRLLQVSPVHQPRSRWLGHSRR